MEINQRYLSNTDGGNVGNEHDGVFIRVKNEIDENIDIRDENEITIEHEENIVLSPEVSQSNIVQNSVGSSENVPLKNRLVFKEESSAQNCDPLLINLIPDGEEEDEWVSPICQIENIECLRIIHYDELVNPHLYSCEKCRCIFPTTSGCHCQNNNSGRGNAGESCDDTGEVQLLQLTTNNKSRGRGRGQGRGRGRGRGQGVQSVVQDDVLRQRQAERQLTKSEVRREVVKRKREAHLERMLLPDAPPRQRQSKKKSPERMPCIMASQQTVSDPSNSIECHSADPAETVSMDIGAEVDVVSSSTAKPSTSGTQATGVSDNGFEVIMEEWLRSRLTDACNSDDDFNEIENVDDPCIVQSDFRYAETEPACITDLTAFQADVLKTEDLANDLALRDIVTDDCYTFDWTKDRQTFLAQRETFIGRSGPTFDLTNQTPIDIFDKMIDADFIDFLCKETNRYAEQKIAKLLEQNSLPNHSRFNRWTPTTRDEMITFLTIIILQGLYPLPEEESFFTFNGFGTMSYFAKIMSYNRFLLLKTMLHFSDNETSQDKTRLNKIRPVIDYFNDKFSSLYMPSQEIAIDESLLKWHGRLNFAQKISSKAAKVGVKTYELCESSSGYLWKFFVYVGKETSSATTDNDNGTRITEPDQEQTNDETDNRPVTSDNPDRQSSGVTTGCPTNATAKIVYDLIEPLLHLGHTLIMDNFYNSPLLLRYLKKQKTDCFGTLRLNREFVPDSVKNINKTELRHGEVVATYCSDLSVLVWRDANIVSLISTYHNLEIGTKDKFNRITYKPSIVLDYNKTMGGIDKKDQYLSAQPMERVRNRVWYKKLFRRLFNCALFNCYVLFSTGRSNILHRKFRIILAEDLIRRHRQIDLTHEHRRLNIRSSTTGQVITTTVRRTTRKKTQDRPKVDHNHFPVRTGSKHTCCWLCPKTTRTIWKCEECDVNLCINGCFKAYHKP